LSEQSANADLLSLRLDESDVKRREIGVMFEDLNVVGLGASAKYQDNLASFLNPRNIVKDMKASRHPATRDILSGFSGVVRPGEMMRTFLA
jgi:ATP-binding cassette subfamily G (WHITE) protein 2 (SNQ2)